MMMPGSENPIRVLVTGYRGRMGATVAAAVEAADGMVVAGRAEIEDDLRAVIAECDATVAVDFTTPHTVATNLETYIACGVHPVIGTTGLPAEELERARARCKEAGLGGLIAPNFAIGAVLMMQLSKTVAKHMSGVEIIEYHHPQKLDAPSGTSLRTREGILEMRPDRDVPIHSVRLPGYLAHQEVIFGNPGERLTLRHDSIDRSCFMPGVVLAVRRVPGLKELLVGLEQLL